MHNAQKLSARQLPIVLGTLTCKACFKKTIEHVQTLKMGSGNSIESKIHSEELLRATLQASITARGYSALQQSRSKWKLKRLNEQIEPQWDNNTYH